MLNGRVYLVYAETGAETLVLGLINETHAGASRPSTRVIHDWIRTFTGLKDVSLIYTALDIILLL